MRKQNNSLWVKSILSIAVAASATSCVDNNYDLTDIDTTSRFTVNNLTVPVPLGEIKLENVIDLDDNENISTINGEYAIQKGGDISTSSFSISSIHVNSPSIAPTNKLIDLQSDLSVSGNIPPFDYQLSDIPNTDYNIAMNNVDGALIRLDNIKSANNILVEVSLSIPKEVMKGGNSVSFQNLTMQFPWGLITDEASYSPSDGYLYIDELQVGTDGKATFHLNATGLDLQDKGTVDNGNLQISGNVGIQSGAIHFDLKDVNIPKNFNLNVEYKVSSFDITSFSGDIDYHMDNVNIAPITLSDLPDFLDSPDTKLFINNPEINVLINNPVGSYGLQGTGIIKLTSEFKEGNTTVAESDPFVINAYESNTEINYNKYNFNNLTNVLANENVGGLPSSIKVNLEGIRFYGYAVDFPLGTNFGNAQGNYTFTAPFSFGKGSIVIYETTEDGWGSEDLDDVNITLLRVTAKCATNLPVGVKLSVTPVDKYGNLIPVKEPKDLEVKPFASGQDVIIELQGEGGPIHGFDGVRFRAVVSQDADYTEALGPDLFIQLTEVRATVDGYYETDF